MRLPAERKYGQTPHDFSISVLLSFALHAGIVVVSFVVMVASRPRFQIPVSYEVKLVGTPRERTVAPPSAPTPQIATPRRIAAPAPAPPKKAHAKPPPAPSKPSVARNAMPDLSTRKQTPSQPSTDTVERKEAARTPPQASSPSVPTAAPGRPAKSDSVAISAEGAGIGADLYYLDLMRGKIKQYWNYPAGARGLKVKVQFTILRSGRIQDVKLQETSGNYYFDAAAIRAIQQANPFPPLPEGTYRPSETFSVDLMPKEQ